MQKLNGLGGVIMGWKMNPNAVNQLSKGTHIYTEGELVFSVAMIIKGRVLIHNDGCKIVVGSGTFLGINDLYAGKFQSSYEAYDDLLLYVFPISRVEDLEVILSTNKDYHGFMVASFYKIISELDQIYQGLIKQGLGSYQFIVETYEKYQKLAAQWGVKEKSSARITELSEWESELEPLSDRINYYTECKKLPMDAIKLFYSYGNAVTLFQVEDQVNIVNQQLDGLKEMAADYISMAEVLVDESNTCLFHMISDLSVNMGSDAIGSNELMDFMDTIIEEVNHAELFTERMLGKKLKVDRIKMEEVYHQLLIGNQEKETSSQKAAVKYTKEDIKLTLTELKDSFQKILEYAGMEGDQAAEMKNTMRDYVQMKDKFAADDASRAIRRQLAENHYLIYKPVFLRAYKEKSTPRLIELFLKYGFADEKLLTSEQIISLYFLEDKEPKQGPCEVYDIREWLTLIYEGKREPSKNEFDLEYPEMLAGLRKQAKLTEKQVQQWLVDVDRKLEYEIQNMFRYNNRTTNGHITSFVPVLHKDQWANNIDRMHATSAKINEAIAGIMRIDYSVFDREVLYVNKEKNIVKEYIIKRVFPDIILMPNVGSNGVMWQDITGKRRDSAGRFLLPTFTEVNITTILIHVIGKYRWEICRTVEGTAWNDIKRKSLTSEYSDYLQFYRKNKELSEEKKEKIKHQIQKGRNSSREIFVIDYDQWMNYEAKGAIKLNKTVREMMATYCPFSKEIRERIKLQPLFEEAMARYYRDKQKKVREIESRYRALQKEQIELTPELVEALNYHRDL